MFVRTLWAYSWRVIPTRITWHTVGGQKTKTPKQCSQKSYFAFFGTVNEYTITPVFFNFHEAIYVHTIPISYLCNAHFFELHTFRLYQFYIRMHFKVLFTSDHMVIHPIHPISYLIFVIFYTGRIFQSQIVHPKNY